MGTIEYTEVFADGSEVVYVRIDRGNGEFTSMTKAFYEAQQVEHLTEIIPADEA